MSGGTKRQCDRALERVPPDSPRRSGARWAARLVRGGAGVRRGHRLVLTVLEDREVVHLI
jgi:hypothetical protein